MQTYRIDRYGDRSTVRVFIPMSDFHWYNERNGHLSQLQAAGVITNPRYLSNGVEITLTQAVKHFLDKQDGDASMNKEKIYEILVTLRTKMKMPDNCFGYERREANGIIKFLQNEGLLSGVGIAEGGARKPPAIIWLDGANITLKGLRFIEDYEKSTNESAHIDLTHEFVSACAKIADNPASYACLDEDGLNREIRNLLDSAISRFGYTIADQTQQGLSGSNPGELDIRINKNGIPVGIYKGLIHRERQYLFDHINKAIEKYNGSGCKAVYVVEYSRNKGFGRFWDNACDAIDEYRGVSAKEENTGLLGVKMLKGTFNWEGQKGDFYYIGVNCHIK